MWNELNFISIPLLRNECPIAGTHIYKKQIDRSFRMILHPLICEVKSMSSFWLHTTYTVFLQHNGHWMWWNKCGAYFILFEGRKLRATVVNLLLWQYIVDQKLKSNDQGLEQRELSLCIEIGARPSAGIIAKIISFKAHFKPETKGSSLFYGWGNEELRLSDLPKSSGVLALGWTVASPKISWTLSIVSIMTLSSVKWEPGSGPQWLPGTFSKHWCYLCHLHPSRWRLCPACPCSKPFLCLSPVKVLNI